MRGMVSSIFSLGLALIAGFYATLAYGQAPYGGTVYTVPNMYVESDPSTLQTFVFNGMETSEEYDHRGEDWFEIEFYAFVATYADGQEVWFLVNGEYDTQRQAEFAGKLYAKVLGQMPRLLRQGVDYIVVHETGSDWSASPGVITIHDGAVEQEASEGALEESMIHETVHASLDEDWSYRRDWAQAQREDGGFISDYGQENPDSEDFAESFTLYLGLSQHPGRMPAPVVETMLDIMPARLKFFARHFPPSKLGL